MSGTSETSHEARFIVGLFLTALLGAVGVLFSLSMDVAAELGYPRVYGIPALAGLIIGIYALGYIALGDFRD